MDTLLELVLATARSGLPSRLKSPTATESGFVPAPKLVAAPKPPVPLPSSTDTSLEPRLATARSGLPSRLKSPTATETGFVPTPKLVSEKLSPAQEQRLVFRRTDTLLEVWLAVARSGLPSRLKSPTATEYGSVPAVKLVAAPKLPVPLPSSTDTLLALKPTLDVARSGLPSRLKSPTATEIGFVPTPKL